MLGPRHVISRLTGHQREVLRVVVNLGYYQEPREATHDQIAAATGLSDTSMGEHLQKIETTVFLSPHDSAIDR